ncbi:MAG: c-type cytochrome [Gammaproteobacteria bacterium]|nr:c-type cytochrome [Gammaproteobacteria bacterium]MDH5303108.1 c-type cytochrome [Gammaproteobacteria bacterium]MDH5323148.1 c-type cytochrome [Gammaproteobacteria bacterium]
MLRFRPTSIGLLFVLASCATDTGIGPLVDYEEVNASTIIDAPSPTPGQSAPGNLYVAERGEYLVELLGCGACHTDGALVGEPNFERSLAGSQVGIAWNNPLGDRYPAVVYPPNITPDIETGIGKWSDQQIANAIRAGLGRHGERRIAAMPWQGYATISDSDIVAITAYLRSIEPVAHRVPDEVAPGQRATAPFVYFGVYRSR